ncbi:hypothetical protein [Salinilacihabitans rarus]|uniref:hypothetical protein n=1 Tax=Salinilacihabitans rarus TaxID=2961596 RepID=UPI0020C89256|nr:hypothetical protein [Salinilacihabitans rarus]
MSTTAPSPSENGTGSISAARAFDRVVWHNPECCNGCFERIKHVDAYTVSFGATDHDVQDHHRTAHATLEPDTESHDDYGELEVSIPRTTCRTCGRIGCWADDDTLTKVQALRLTTPLLRRLEEAGVEASGAKLRRAVRQLKSVDAIQGFDTEIFRRATKLAVREARSR